ncbi:MAG TPA: hypothetical protein VLC95_08930 [Anaerolineae bacterium]|nr:hypothetical protein [Anaerolineae bacterium]
MKSLEEVVGQVVRHPTPDALVDLQGVILASSRSGEAMDQALDVAGHFYSYLSELESKLSARNFSELASRLDIGAVGTVALESVLAGQADDLWKRLMMGGLGEMLMVAASRQYVRGWEVETDLVHRQAVWYLTEALWRASSRAQADAPVEARWQAISSLLAPARAADVAPEAKAVLLGRVFQILVLALVARLAERPEE